jgi:integrase
MGLGSAYAVSISRAREMATGYRALLAENIDPIEDRKMRDTERRAAQAKIITFDQAAARYIDQHAPGWKNPVHIGQWTSSLKAYASPILGHVSVADIETEHIMKVLDQIWHQKTETASRVRGRIEAVLDWAAARGYRKRENPARWRNHLKNLLPAPAKVRPVKHQLALQYDEMPTFVQDLRKRTGMSALALEFCILTCVRASDVRDARIVDIDIVRKVWIIPKFSKTAAEHRVPLSSAALAVLEKARLMAGGIGGDVANSPFAFPNDLTGNRLSDNAMLALLKRMGRKGTMTTHGCRATFRTWAQEQTSFPWELCELSLGHKVGSKVERAYARGDGLKKRFTIMQAWATYCSKASETPKVIPIWARSA